PTRLDRTGVAACRLGVDGCTTVAAFAVTAGVTPSKGSQRARGGTRTHTPSRTADFESAASAIPPPGPAARLYRSGAPAPEPAAGNCDGETGAPLGPGDLA